MTEEIYGDVLFIINFSMDFLSLYITGKILKINMKAWRVIISATFGGIYGVAALFFPFDSVTSAVFNLLCAAVMCLIAFFYGNIPRFLVSVLIFYASGMLLGGIMIAIYKKLGKYTGYISVGGSIVTVFGEIPIWIFAALAAASALLTFFAGRIFSHKNAVRTCVMTVCFSGRCAEISCLTDSGNLLCEPITSTPVVFISRREADIVPPEILSAMKNGGTTKNFEVMKKLRFIPSSTVTGGQSIVAAVPDGCYIGKRGSPEPKKALVAVKFSDGDFDGYGGLVPASLL